MTLHTTPNSISAIFQLLKDKGGWGGPDTNDDIDDALRGGNHKNDDVLTL